MADKCDYCEASYAAMQHDGRTHIYRCKSCGVEFCEFCWLLEEIGKSVFSIHCPSCNSDGPALLNLRDRFSISSPLSRLIGAQRGIVLLFQPRSALVQRNEKVILQAMDRLGNVEAELIELDETDARVQEFVTQSFPNHYNFERDGGRGSIFWIRDGVPVTFMHGGPHRVMIEILEMSRASWPLDIR